jgi:protein-tyrosine phosphatase
MSDSDPETRIIPLQGGINFRDLGGYAAAVGRRVRRHRLFRSGTTHSLSEVDRGRLAGLGIRAVVDLRSNWERQEHPHGLSGCAGVRYTAYDHERAGGDLMRMLEDPHLRAMHLRDAMIEHYRQLPYEFRDIYQQLFRSVAAGPLPLVFNCAAGKDRTGVAAALLLGALGVVWEDIMVDYLLTERFVPDIMRTFRSSRAGKMLSRWDTRAVAPLFGVDRAYLDAMREAIVARNGSIENYLLSELSLESDVLEALRRRLLV